MSTDERASIDNEQPEIWNREDCVRVRAYYLFLERGSDEGDDVADWLRAEELEGERGSETGASSEEGGGEQGSQPSEARSKQPRAADRIAAGAAGRR